MSNPPVPTKVRSLFCPVTHYPNLKSALDVVREKTVIVSSARLRDDDLVMVMIQVGDDPYVVTLQEQTNGGWVFVRVNNPFDLEPIGE